MWILTLWSDTFCELQGAIVFLVTAESKVGCLRSAYNGELKVYTVVGLFEQFESSEFRSDDGQIYNI